MTICDSGRSAPSAFRIADESDEIRVNRGRTGDINWGRYRANTELNPDISNSTNKRVMRELFREHGVPMPELIPAREGLFAHDEYGELTKPLVGRPDYHRRKRGFWLCNTVADIQRALRGTRKKRAATHFMEYVNADREYRVHIFKGKSIRISEKVFVREQGERKCYTIKPQHPVGNVRKAAKKAVEALGLDFGAVDILAAGDENEQVWVLEVNAAPGLGGSMPRLYARVFEQWARGEW